MSKYLIEGGNKLKGKVKISGNKNSILPCLSACLLTDEEVVLRNVPSIADVGVFLEILKELGATVKSGDHLLKINCQGVKRGHLPIELVSKLRASILLIGPLLSKLGKVEFSHPGGDVIGKRTIESHLEGLKGLGYKFKNSDRYYQASREKTVNSFKELFLYEASVTATENLILAAVLSKGEVVLKNCAREPHVVDLCNLLRQMGARIEGVGQSILTVKGVDRLGGAEFTIGADYVELGTYAIATALTKGEIEVEKDNLPDLDPIVYPLRKMGVIFQDNNHSISIFGKTVTAIPKLLTNIWPGFPTDMMSVAIVLATQAKGVSLCHDWMYESRMFFVDKLISMGANITIADPHRVLISGPTRLNGRNLESPDIRAGMALVLAALVASGQSVINRAELIERGYEDVVGKLSSLGAKIQKVA